MHFIWKVDRPGNNEHVFSLSQPVIEKIKVDIPVHSTCAMSKMLFSKFGRVGPSVKLAVLHYFYKDLTGYRSSPFKIDEAVIGERVQAPLFDTSCVTLRAVPAHSI